MKNITIGTTVSWRLVRTLSKSMLLQFLFTFLTLEFISYHYWIVAWVCAPNAIIMTYNTHYIAKEWKR